MHLYIYIYIYIYIYVMFIDGVVTYPNEPSSSVIMFIYMYVYCCQAKRGVVLTARVHPGESNGSWMMKGVLDFLTGSSDDAKVCVCVCMCMCVCLCICVFP